jgi:hypothetical protein
VARVRVLPIDFGTSNTVAMLRAPADASTSAATA